MSSCGSTGFARGQGTELFSGQWVLGATHAIGKELRLWSLELLNLDMSPRVILQTNPPRLLRAAVVATDAAKENATINSQHR